MCLAPTFNANIRCYSPMTLLQKHSLSILARELPSPSGPSAPRSIPATLLSPPPPPSMDNKKRKLEDNGGSQITSEDMRKVMEPFTKEELLDILQEAAACHEDVLEQVRKLADRDPSNRRVFVRGLGWDTTSESLKKVFLQYGELDEVVVVTDKGTGKSKGFGFVTYMHVDCAVRALKEPSKKIDGRITVSQLAGAGPPTPQTLHDQASRKIFVGDCPLDLDADKLLTLFSKYGEIVEGPLGLDKTTEKSKGFALFIYKTVEGAKRALEEPVKTIEGHRIYCKLAWDNLPRKWDGALQKQSDNVDLALQQAGNIAGAISGGYHTSLYGSSRGIHPGRSVLTPSVVQQLGLGGSSFGYSLDSPLRSSLSSSYNASLLHDGSRRHSYLGHIPSSLSPSSLGVHGSGTYGSALRGPQSSYATYGVPNPSNTSDLQGGGSDLSAQLPRAAGSRLQSFSSYYST